MYFIVVPILRCSPTESQENLRSHTHNQGNLITLKSNPLSLRPGLPKFKSYLGGGKNVILAKIHGERGVNS